MNRFVLMTGLPDGEVRHAFWCPGCKDGHQIRTAGAAGVWQFNGDLASPTVSPSILVTMPDPANPGQVIRRCHSYVREGRIEFLSDCSHELAGKSVDLPTWNGTGFDQ